MTVQNILYNHLSRRTILVPLWQSNIANAAKKSSRFNHIRSLWFSTSAMPMGMAPDDKKACIHANRRILNSQCGLAMPYDYRSKAKNTDVYLKHRRIYHSFHSMNSGVSCCRINPIHNDKLHFSCKHVFGVVIKRFAGHSKWANIRHIKAAKDGEKSMRAGRAALRIKIAIREGGGSDPKFNVQLARVIDQANKDDVPKTTIENAIKSAIKANNEGSLVLNEAKGPGNFVMVIETFTDSPKRTKLDINAVFKKLGGTSCEKIASAFFDHKGVIMVKPSATLNTFEELEEAAIMAEAEEIHEEPDEDGNTMYKVICDPSTVYTVRKQMVSDHPDVLIDSATHRYIPKSHSMAPLSGPTLETAVKILDALEKIPDVVRVYTNIEVSEDS